MKEIKKNYKDLIADLLLLGTEKEENVEDLEELWSLVHALENIEIVGIIQQKHRKPDRKTHIGSGKVEELKEKVKTLQVDIVVMNAFLKPRQVFTLQERVKTISPTIQVWDKVDLVLEIFAKHAQTKEANLQIKLARMRHMGPRIYGMGFELSQQAGRVGTVGIGETNTELMRRHWRAEIRKVHKELDRLILEHQNQVEERKKHGLKTVSIVGYTNVGKTSLFNKLTKKKQYVKSAPFATLDSHVGRMYLREFGGEVIVTDTIGFIKNLPLQLIDAFRSTLLESVHADLLVHVVDSGDERLHEKIQVVESLLNEIHAPLERIIAFNKIDLLTSTTKREELANRYESFEPIFISAIGSKGLDELKKKIAAKLTAKEFAYEKEN